LIHRLFNFFFDQKIGLFVAVGLMSSMAILLLLVSTVEGQEGIKACSDSCFNAVSECPVTQKQARFFDDLSKCLQKCITDAQGG